MQIAGQCFEIQHLYEYIKEYCKDYVIREHNKPEEINFEKDSSNLIVVTQSDINFERDKSAAEDRKEGIPIRHFTDEYLETLAVYRKIARQTHKSTNPANARKTMELIDRLLEVVPIYRLSCNMERSAAKVAYEGMQNE